jgi:hypothetical protein
MKTTAVLIIALLTACASSGPPAGDIRARSEQQCQSRGHAAGSEAFRACVESEELGAAAATQREYDRKLLRRLDCVDPRLACDGPSR